MYDYCNWLSIRISFAWYGSFCDAPTHTHTVHSIYIYKRGWMDEWMVCYVTAFTCIKKLHFNLQYTPPCHTVRFYCQKKKEDGWMNSNAVSHTIKRNVIASHRIAFHIFFSWKRQLRPVTKSIIDQFWSDLIRSSYNHSFIHSFIYFYSLFLSFFFFPPLSVRPYQRQGN